MLVSPLGLDLAYVREKGGWPGQVAESSEEGLFSILLVTFLPLGEITNNLNLNLKQERFSLAHSFRGFSL